MIAGIISEEPTVIGGLLHLLQTEFNPAPLTPNRV